MSDSGQRVCLELGREIKAQRIRILDVILIGPMMMAGGHSLFRQGKSFAGMALGAFGVATIWYNGRNYVRVKHQLELQRVGQIG